MTVLDLLNASGYVGESPEKLARVFISELANTKPSSERNYFLDKPTAFLAIDTDYYAGLSLSDLANLGVSTKKVML